MGADLDLILFREGHKGVRVGCFGSAKRWPNQDVSMRFMQPSLAVKMLEETGAKEAGVDVELAVQQIREWETLFPGCTIGFDDDCRCWSFCFTDVLSGIDEAHALHVVISDEMLEMMNPHFRMVS